MMGSRKSNTDATPANAAADDIATDTEGLTSAFATLGIHPRIADALTALGYEEPTPVQRASIPPLLAGRDVLAQAATGTGKTAAFALPLLTRIAGGARSDGGPSALILTPTRELAMQVAEAVHRYGKPMGISALAVYGGASMEMQVRALRRGVDVVIATPGRALDHIRRDTLRLATLKCVVLDEADEMLDMGFADELEAILSATPKSRQTALFSATLPPRIASIATSHLRDPERITVERERVPEGETARVRQVAYIVPRAHKMPALARLLDIEQPTSAIVFCRTRTEVDELRETLATRGLRAEALHGGLSQDQRDRVMQKFRAKTVDLLVATDVAARGLDVKHVSHVVNFDVPVDAETYVHRIGRTGRAGREGVAITLAEPREHRLLRNIERQVGHAIEVAQLPTVADLRAHRRELLQATVREAIVGGGLDAWHGVVESLAQEYDIMDVAAAAMRLLAAGADGAEDSEIPAATARSPRESSGGERREPRSDDGGGDRGRGKAPARARTKEKQRKTTSWEAVTLWLGAGRKLNIRPGDLVGAIANEAGLDSTQIGAIQIADGYSTVEVPALLADDVIAAIKKGKIKGKKVQVRRSRN